MDITTSVESCKNIIETLKSFPKHRRCPLTVQWRPKKLLENAHSEMLRKCIPFINKIVKDMRNTLNALENGGLAEIESRKAFVQKKLDEAKQCREAQTKRNQIVKEIERLEKMNAPKIRKVVLDDVKSGKIIDYLFENDINVDCTGKTNVSDFIELTYDKTASRKTDSYDKILQLF